MYTSGITISSRFQVGFGFMAVIGLSPTSAGTIEPF